MFLRVSMFRSRWAPDPRGGPPIPVSHRPTLPPGGAFRSIYRRMPFSRSPRPVLGRRHCNSRCQGCSSHPNFWIHNYDLVDKLGREATGIAADERTKSIDWVGFGGIQPFARPPTYPLQQTGVRNNWADSGCGRTAHLFEQPHCPATDPVAGHDRRAHRAEVEAASYGDTREPVPLGSARLARPVEAAPRADASAKWSVQPLAG
jgi:hypothetical protein